MYFKKLELAGFKSFADRIEVSFEGGITAIVGPNGCGKSNIADAIRWVLGSQSPKLLRGNSMQDVIFNGTEKRKSLSYCEVTLTFNNHDRFFNDDHDEVAITRKLFRNGDSEYLMNRQPCRLKDIVDLLYDSGLGKDGYSIIGQGKVAEIISSKPEDRRSIFEDAAGISKFKAHKQEAERKLERTRENLIRLRDIIGEIERQLGPLLKQAENARKYNELRDSLRLLEVNAYIYQYENANSAKAKINQKLKAIAEELSLRQEELEQANQEYNTHTLSVENLDKTLSMLSETILTVSLDMEKQSSETKVVRERIKNLTEQNNRMELEIAQAKAMLSVLSSELDARQKFVAIESEQLVVSKKQAQNLENDYLKVVDELILVDDEAEQSQSSMISSYEKLTDVKANFSRLQAEKQAGIQNIKELLERESALTDRIRIQKETSSADRTKAGILEKESATLANTISTAKTETAELSEKIQTAEAILTDLTTKNKVYENRHRMLTELQASYEGFAGSVAKLLKEADKNPAIKSKMIGVIANLIKVPEKFETAIEMCLGNALQNIVTENENAATELIQFLKQNQFGRATFLPVSSMHPRSLEIENKRFLTAKGSYGLAKDLISYPSKIESVISNLLGATVVVEDLDIAKAMARESRYAFRIVTLEGDVVSTQGSFTGGSKRGDSAGIMGREREIKTLTEDIAKNITDIAEKERIVRKAKEKLAENQKLLALLESNQKTMDISLAKQNEKVEAAQQLMDDLQAQKDELSMQITRLEGKVELIDRELKSVDELESSIKTNTGAVSSSIAERARRAVELKKKRDEMNVLLTSGKVQIASSEAAVLAAQNDAARMAEQQKTTFAALTENERLFAVNRKAIDESELFIADRLEKTANKEMKEKLENLRSEQGKTEEKKGYLQNEIKRINSLKNDLMNEINAINDKKLHEELKLSRVDAENEAMAARMAEEYNLPSYEACLPFKDEQFNIQAGQLEINLAKKEIAKLGYINLSAIEESKEVRARFENLSEQEKDLTKAESDLKEIINELASEMMEKFSAAFHQINSNFRKTFSELFGGGQAELKLTGSDDLLLAGVDIEAQPPGKKLQNINLLSGGEMALTAIAILFAILKLRPMPFCLLDEIEAALDDSNVMRFAQYLHRFSKETQFIIITHRKPTMELADNLYGITMEEKGVSTTASVKMKDALSYIDSDKKSS